MVQVEIRKYEPQDLDEIMVIWRAATVLAHDFQGEEELDRDEARIRNEYIDQTESWTAWIDGDLTGFISLAGNVIVALFVDPAVHRAGVGSVLLSHANKVRGPLAVEVFAENAVGMPFYKKHGFKFIREEKDPLYPDNSLWIMGQEGARP